MFAGYGLGWSSTPLAGKRPTRDAWQSDPRESLEQALTWAAAGNVGLRTGSNSGIVAIDLDQYKPEFDAAAVASLNLPATVTTTMGGGQCLLHRTGERIGNSAGQARPARGCQSRRRPGGPLHALRRCPDVRKNVPSDVG